MNEMLRNNDQMSHRIFETQKRLYESELVKMRVKSMRSEVRLTPTSFTIRFSAWVESP